MTAAQQIEKQKTWLLQGTFLGTFHIIAARGVIVSSLCAFLGNHVSSLVLVGSPRWLVQAGCLLGGSVPEYFENLISSVPVLLTCDFFYTMLPA